MRDSYPQSLENILKELEGSNKSTLQLIQQRATILLKLNRTVMALLPAPLQGKCRVANYRNAILIIEVTNASWMTRLRYEIPSLLSALRKEILPSLSSIDIKINPSLSIKAGKKSVTSSLKDPTPVKKTPFKCRECTIIEIFGREKPEEIKRKIRTVGCTCRREYKYSQR